MITAIGICRARPGQEEELGRRLRELVAPTSTEEGCLRYDLYRSDIDRSLWVLLEAWRSQADLDAHVETPHLRAFLARNDEVMLGKPDNYRLSLVLRSDSDLMK
jgi:quinol monooxygenase YgiN